MLLSILISLSMLSMVNANVIIEGCNISGVAEISNNSHLCPNGKTNMFEPKLLRKEEVKNKNFTVLIDPGYASKFPETAKTFLESLRCYFDGIEFSFVTFEDSGDTDVCRAFAKLSNRTAKSLNPLVVVFHQSNPMERKVDPPCTKFENKAITFQVTIGNNSVGVFIRADKADYVMRSYPNCPTLFDSMATVINPMIYKHEEYRFPYQPLQKRKLDQEAEESKAVHIVVITVFGIIVGFLIFFITPAIVVWRRVKSRQQERDRERQLREALLKSKMELEPKISA